MGTTKGPVGHISCHGCGDCNDIGCKMVVVMNAMTDEKCTYCGGRLTDWEVEYWAPEHDGMCHDCTKEGHKWT